MKNLIVFMFLISCFSFAGGKQSKKIEVDELKFQLFYAVQDKDINKVDELIKKVEILDYKASSVGDSLLMIAIAKRNDKMVKFLIDKGASVDWKNIYGQTVLEYAIKYGNLKTLKLIMDKKPDYGNTLIRAVFQNNVIKVKEFLDKGVSVEDKEFSEYITPLMVAAFMNNKEIMKILIERGASIDKMSEYGKTPVLFAICNNSIDTLQFLISLGGDINSEGNNGKTPVMEACELNYPNILEILIQNGASLETKFPLLSVCAEFDSVDVAKKLIEEGKYVNEKDYFDATPLNTAVKYNSLKTAELLIQNGADIENKFEEWDLLKTYECSSLLMAIKNNNKEMVTLLLDNGAKTDYKYNNKSMLSVTDSPKMREFLMTKGFNW
ncbi:MAG: ankyrin repeat domain-containing protein [Fusobacteriaceae bacterium]|nr:ankyrin repeat domain-containing protein [Fusobacteriaceae bacterium]MBN2839155.1 ankyrin repeat domain-containing protein [Fusobacteriaceae bacterium]